MMRRSLIATALLPLLLGGCFGWFGGKDEGEKPAALIEFTPSATLATQWQVNLGGAGDYVLQPAVERGSVYAASADGAIARFDAASGKQIWRVDTGKKISGAVGAGAGVVVAGSSKGEVLAFDADGKEKWQAQVSSEVLSAPQAADGVVVVRCADGKIFGLDAADGKRKWVYQRVLPALALRSFAGVVIARGGVFAGFAGGKLVALNLANGNVGWEATVALPRGSNELERIADVTSLPVVDARQVCAVAYQGRVACFDIRNGNPVWGRDLSSSAGLAVDQRYVYVTDERGAVMALDKTSGASVWKQDKLTARRVTAPLVRGKSVAVADLQGYVHLLSAEDGSFAARIATDGSAVRSQAVALDDGLLVQTVNGGVFAMSIK
jgi:outer membrane protein assembly factor BamB